SPALRPAPPPRRWVGKTKPRPLSCCPEVYPSGARHQFCCTPRTSDPSEPTRTFLQRIPRRPARTAEPAGSGGQRQKGGREMRAIKCLVLHATFALALAGCESAPASWPEPLGLENARWERIDTDLGPAPALSLTNVAGDHLAWPGEHVTLHEVRLDTLEGGRWTMFALTFEQT